MLKTNGIYPYNLINAFILIDLRALLEFPSHY